MGRPAVATWTSRTSAAPAVSPAGCGGAHGDSPTSAARRRRRGGAGGAAAAVVFAAFAKRPIVVGGQMLDRARAHGRALQRPSGSTPTRSLGTSRPGDRGVRSNSRRSGSRTSLDAGFNGWWSCLIPPTPSGRSACGCRSSSSGTTWSSATAWRGAGFRTVTLPGSAVWHEPWTLKDDSTDWTLVLPRAQPAHLLCSDVGGAAGEGPEAAACAHDPGCPERATSCVTSCGAAYASAAAAELAMRDFLGAGVLDEPLQDGRRSRPCRIAPASRTLPRGCPTGGHSETPRPHSADARARRFPSDCPGRCSGSTDPGAQTSCRFPCQLLRKKSADPWRIWQHADDYDDHAEVAQGGRPLVGSGRRTRCLGDHG